MSFDAEKLKYIVEAALLAAARPLNLDHLISLFEEDEKPEKAALREALKALAKDLAPRSVELKEVASGWRIQVRQDYLQWTSRLWEERPTRYSRALLETLALVAYRQPITRGEIEDVRGVSVSTNIIKTMLDRNWIRIVGHRDVPGRPAMFGTTRDFLDYFGLKSLDELPTLAQLRDIDSINTELDFDAPQLAGAQPANADPEMADENTAPENINRMQDESQTRDDRDSLPEEAESYDTQENNTPQDRRETGHPDNPTDNPGHNSETNPEPDLGERPAQEDNDQATDKETH